MKGYKAYDHGLICREKRYEVGQNYEEPKAEICVCGMHYCDNPADLMYYHDLIDENGEIMEVTEVEDLSPEAAQSQEDGNSKKYCTTKLKIGEKISFGEWVKATVDFLLEKTKGRTERVSDERFTRLAASGNSSRLAASGNSSQLAASGEDSVVCIAGMDGMAKAAKGCWITLAEWEYNEGKDRYIPVCVKTEQVDGERIKADTWYQLIGGEVVEAENR